MLLLLLRYVFACLSLSCLSWQGIGFAVQSVNYEYILLVTRYYIL